MRKKLAVGIATVFFAGLLPAIRIPFTQKKQKVGGTAVSVVSLPICLLLYALYWGATSKVFGPLVYLAATIGLLALAQWAIPLAEEWLGPRPNHRGIIVVHDHNEIGIDETLGMVISTYPIAVVHPAHWFWWTIAAFVLFRIFDIVKPPPANLFNRWPTPMGVMLDDVFAAFYAALAVIAGLAVFSSLPRS